MTKSISRTSRRKSPLIWARYWRTGRRSLSARSGPNSNGNTLRTNSRPREQRIAELERHIGERDENDRQSESERQAEAQRKREEAHVERVKGAKSYHPDFDPVMAKMARCQIHEDLIEDVLASEKWRF